MKALNVIPAKAGIQCFQVRWTPTFVGVTVWMNEIFLKLTALGPGHQQYTSMHFNPWEDDDGG